MKYIFDLFSCNKSHIYIYVLIFLFYEKLYIKIFKLILFNFFNSIKIMYKIILIELKKNIKKNLNIIIISLLYKNKYLNVCIISLKRQRKHVVRTLCSNHVAQARSCIRRRAPAAERLQWSAYCGAPAMRRLQFCVTIFR